MLEAFFGRATKKEAPFVSRRREEIKNLSITEARDKLTSLPERLAKEPGLDGARKI